MGTIGNPQLARLAMLGWCGLGLIGTAAAAPPITQRGAEHLYVHPSLDLRPSATAMAAMAAVETSPAAFPSALHRQPLGAQENIRLPELGSGNQQTSAKGRMEDLVQRAHREGLPVARLWENKSALLHLGLNQRGKPGLWIIQKIH
jgi:hypothetical protein